MSCAKYHIEDDGEMGHECQSCFADVDNEGDLCPDCESALRAGDLEECTRCGAIYAGGGPCPYAKLHPEPEMKDSLVALAMASAALKATAFNDALSDLRDDLPEAPWATPYHRGGTSGGQQARSGRYDARRAAAKARRANRLAHHRPTRRERGWQI